MVPQPRLGREEEKGNDISYYLKRARQRERTAKMEREREEERWRKRRGEKGERAT